MVLQIKMAKIVKPFFIVNNFILHIGSFLKGVTVSGIPMAV